MAMHIGDVRTSSRHRSFGHVRPSIYSSTRVGFTSRFLLANTMPPTACTLLWPQPTNLPAFASCISQAPPTPCRLLSPDQIGAAPATVPSSYSTYIGLPCSTSLTQHWRCAAPRRRSLNLPCRRYIIHAHPSAYIHIFTGSHLYFN